MILKSNFPDAVIPETPLGQYVMEALKQQDPDALAIIEMISGNFLTYKQLCDQAQQLTGLLWRAGLRKGDIVGLVLPFDLKYTPLFIAISCCGGVLFGCKLLYQSSFYNQLRSIKPTFLITTNDRYDQISTDIKQEVPSLKLCLSFDQLKNIQPGSIRSRDNDMPCYGCIDVHNDAAIIFQSSGTTGQPKGIVTTHYAMVALLTSTKSSLGLFPGDVLAANATIIHAQSLNGFLSCATQGVTFAYASSLTAEQHLEFASKYKVTILGIANVNYLREIIDHKQIEIFDLSSLKSIVVGGTTFPAELIEQARSKFGVIVCMGYGTTEAGYVSLGFSNKTPPNSVGRLVCNIQVKIMDNGREVGPGEKGEICIAGAQLMKEYFISNETIVQGVKDGWMHSGDLGFYDKQGYLYVVGRLKEAIKIQPGNVTAMPAELEDLIRRHSKVLDVAIVGVPHPDYGEAPRAFVVRKDETLLEEELILFFNNQVENVTSLHGGVEFVSVIPRTETGKTVRQQLLENSRVNLND